MNAMGLVQSKWHPVLGSLLSFQSNFYNNTYLRTYVWKIASSGDYGSFRRDWLYVLKIAKGEDF